jgi:hypothetical protein
MRDRTPYVKLVFLHPVGSAGHVVQCGASGARNIDALFFLLRWDRYGFHKKHVTTCYTKLVFFHSVGYAGHVVHSGAYGARNVDALLCKLGWDWYGFQKKHDGTHCAELEFLHLVRPGRETSTHYFSCLSGTDTDSTKNTSGYLTSNLCVCIRFYMRVT